MNVSLIKTKKPCIICGSRNFAGFYTNDSEFELMNGGTIRFHQQLECCYDCGLVRQQENADYSDKNLERYYKNTHRTPLNLEKLEKSDKRRLNALKRLKFIRKQKNAGTLLEAGYGDGVFLNEARRYFSCSGIDPSEGYTYIKNHLAGRGVITYHSTLEKFPAKHKYDVVCSFLVLEHIKNPLAFLMQLIKHLKPGGTLIIEVPDIKRYFDFNSESMLTHEHVYHYSLETLTLLLAKLGAQLIDANNKNVTYGFSLIASFKLKKQIPHKIKSSGFETLAIFERFINRRESYRQNMAQYIAEIIKDTKAGNKRVAVYGTGFLFNFAVKHKAISAEDPDYFYDDTSGKVGTQINGKKIKPLADIVIDKPDVVLIFSEMFFELMKKNILQHIKGKEVTILDIHKQSV